ncbi:MAG: nucleotidyltransferase family protein [Deltaproteobacteria bacterium]|nr:nucleotidyltransferase family protein [Deltaproteobacteria bacterium]
MNKETIIEKIRIQYPYLISEYGVKRIALFGSYSKNQQTENSDIDIIAEFEKPIGLKFIEFTNYLENILGKKTDVLTPEGVKAITVKKISDDIEKSIIYV